MSDQSMDDIDLDLAKTHQAMAEIQRRLLSEDINEAELIAFKDRVVAQLEQLRTHLETSFGPLDREVIRERMRQELSPDEFNAWERDEAQRHRRNTEALASGSGQIFTEEHGKDA